MKGGLHENVLVPPGCCSESNQVELGNDCCDPPIRAQERLAAKTSILEIKANISQLLNKKIFSMISPIELDILIHLSTLNPERKHVHNQQHAENQIQEI